MITILVLLLYIETAVTSCHERRTPSATIVCARLGVCSSVTSAVNLLRALKDTQTAARRLSHLFGTRRRCETCPHVAWEVTLSYRTHSSQRVGRQGTSWVTCYDTPFLNILEPGSARCTMLHLIGMS